MLVLVLSGTPWTLRPAGLDELPSVSPGEVGYALRRWGAEHGLPTQNVTGLAQTPDGYLWLNTSRSVTRFDGIRFRSFYVREHPGLELDKVGQLVCDSQGVLWVSGLAGGLCRWAEGRNDAFELCRELPTGGRYTILEDRNQSVWALSLRDGRRYPYRDGRFETSNQEDRWPCEGMISLGWLADPSGRFWGITQGRMLAELTQDGPRNQPLAMPDGRPEEEIGDPFLLSDRTLAVAASQGIYTLKGDEWALSLPFHPPLSGGNAVRKAAQDRQGNVWLATVPNALMVRWADGSMGNLTLAGLSKEASIQAFLLDVENNLWIGTQEGLCQIRRTPFRTVGTVDWTRHHPILSMAEDGRQRLWCVNQRDPAFYLAPAELEPVFPDLGSMGIPKLITPGTSDSVWLSPGDGEIWSWDPVAGTRLAARLPDQDGQPVQIQVLCTDSEDALWIATDAGLWRWHQGDLRQAELPGNRREVPVTALVRSSSGNLYAALGNAGGILQLNQGIWQSLDWPAEALKQDILGLAPDPEGGLWLLGFNPGLARWKDGRWFGFSNGKVDVPKLAVSAMADEIGGLWVTTLDRGVIRYDRASLERIVAGSGAPESTPAFRFGVYEGLPTSAGAGSSTGICRTSDGRIWVSTQRGLAVVDPREWEVARDRGRPPQVHVEEALVDDRPVSMKHPSRGLRGRDPFPIVRVPPGPRRIELRFAALGLSSPERNRFRYRLLGLEEQWSPVGDGRSASYTHLPPGDYRFQVIASDGFDNWTPQGATVAVLVEPAWWQRTALRAFAAFLLLVAGPLLYWAQTRRLRRQRALQEEFSRQVITSQEEERKRIAGELHDGLGQNLWAAKNLALLGTLKPLPPEESVGRFREISEVLGTVVEELRDLSKMLRPAELDNLGLTKAIGAVVDRFDNSSNIEVTLTLEDIDGLLSPSDEINLYRLVQESLSNVLRHSRATQLTGQFTRSAGTICVEIVDNGQGFDVEDVLAKGKAGLGLRGMEERARLMGGRLGIDSRPGKGTRLYIRIPIRPRTAQA